MIPQTMKLIKLSLCDCGFNTLQSHIKLGTEYIVYPDSIESDGYYLCGGCKKEQRNVRLVLASKIDDKNYKNWLPADLFFAENA